jgi:hypothetical protein
MKRNLGLAPRALLRRSRLALTASCLGLALALAGCTVTIGRVYPSPATALPRSNERLAFALSPTIRDVFELPFDASTIRVTDFRRSLENGFGESIARFYTPAGAAAPDLTLAFDRAELDLSNPGRVRMVLRYAARLVDRRGRTVGVSFGEVDTSRGQDFDDILTNLLARLFERVASDCFVPPAMRAHADAS